MAKILPFFDRCSILWSVVTQILIHIDSWIFWRMKSNQVILLGARQIEYAGVVVEDLFQQFCILCDLQALLHPRNPGRHQALQEMGKESKYLSKA